ISQAPTPTQREVQTARGRMQRAPTARARVALGRMLALVGLALMLAPVVPARTTLAPVALAQMLAPVAPAQMPARVVLARTMLLARVALAQMLVRVAQMLALVAHQTPGSPIGPVPGPPAAQDLAAIRPARAAPSAASIAAAAALKPTANA